MLSQALGRNSPSDADVSARYESTRDRCEAGWGNLLLRKSVLWYCCDMIESVSCSDWSLLVVLDMRQERHDKDQDNFAQNPSKIPAEQGLLDLEARPPVASVREFMQQDG